MKLQEIFDQLSGGEFSQISIGGANAGVIDESNYGKVLGHVNLGLTALYKRFTLKEGRLVLELQEAVETYKLHSAFAVNGVGSTEPVRYIKDTVAAPFTNDIIKVERVLADSGVELPLNDSSDTTSVFTTSALVLRVPVDTDSDFLTVVYRAAHPKLRVTPGVFYPGLVEVQLPDTHLDALLLYVASRAQAPVGMGAEFNASNAYYGRYERACQELEGKGLQVDQGSQNTRLFTNGWV